MNLSWLHISDIHFRPQTEWRDSLARTALLDHLKLTFSRDETLRPDLIFCTGDIAFGESPGTSLQAQYEQAAAFYDDLLTLCGPKDNSLPKDRLFIVPGNHDVTRSAINSDVQETLCLWAQDSHQHVQKINQRFNDLTKEFKATISRLDHYGDFVRKFLPHQHDDHGRHSYARVIDINGIQVGIAGFNSSWTCSGPADERNIWLAANWQFNTAYQLLKDCDVRVGLIHHPSSWLNSAECEFVTRRLSSDYDFWLHGHEHSAWVTPVQSHIIIAAGAVAAERSDEYGINITKINLASSKGATHLHRKNAGSNSWVIAPVEGHAPAGTWEFDLPLRLHRHKAKTVSPSHTSDHERAHLGHVLIQDVGDRYLTQKLEEALQSFSSQPPVWVLPTVCTTSELARDASRNDCVNLADLAANPRSLQIKAPPQYGLTCLARFLAREAWRSTNRDYWLYLDASTLAPHRSAIDAAILSELNVLGFSEERIRCVLLDSWSSSDKDAFKLLRKVSDRFKDIPVICMERAEFGEFRQPDNPELPRPFDLLYLWSISRTQIRTIVSAYNDTKPIGDEDVVTSRLVSDLEVLNLHRTPLNCITLLKVSEIDFDESPVNRSEMIKRVLFLLFNLNDIPTYKSRPDLKDCEFVLGRFCELLIRAGSNSFTRDKFLLETQQCCKDNLIDLETYVVFDVLVKNNIIVKRGPFFSFRFSYWIFYFAAQRMHHDPKFAEYIYEGMRYAQYPEIIEFYTGIDRRRDDAINILIRDIRACREAVRDKLGFPDGFNPFDVPMWNPSPHLEEQMQKVVTEGVQESSLPATIKDQFADSTYDQTRPYRQEIANLLYEHSYSTMMRTLRAGSRALRNSDYVSTELKRKLLEEIMASWEQASKVLLVVLPVLAAEGHAVYDGSGFFLAHDFGSKPQERFRRILCEIPFNIVSWCQDDLYSRKMGPLLMDQLGNERLGTIARHELMMLLIHRKPRNWTKQVHAYIAESKKNSYYLYDTYQTLRFEYQCGFVSANALKEIEYLIKMAATKHLTGAKEPGAAAMKKIKFEGDVIPSRKS
jgi:calcineurin-like phosphoesterase family protein